MKTRHKSRVGAMQTLCLRAPRFRPRMTLNEVTAIGRGKGRWILPGEVADVLGCSVTFVRFICREGLLRGYRLVDNGWYRIDPESVADLVKRLRLVERHELARARKAAAWD